jgi:hypothetical protein
MHNQAMRGFLVPVGTAVLAVVPGASSTGLVATHVVASVASRRSDEDSVVEAPLVLTVANPFSGEFFGHRSHSSHRSHYSGRGGGGGSGWSGGGTGGDDSQPQQFVAPPPPPKPATVSFAAFPGGRIFVDGRPVGSDASGQLTLTAGRHDVKVTNRFLGEHTVTIDLSEGQTGVVSLDW